jgi:hypothetical protein
MWATHLNLYSMVADDPESFADLDGHDGNGSTVGPGASWAGVSNAGGGRLTEGQVAGMGDDAPTVVDRIEPDSVLQARADQFMEWARATGNAGFGAQNTSVTAAYDPNKPLYTPHGVVYGNPRDPSNPGNALIDNPVVQRASDQAFITTVNGTARGGLAEAGFSIEYSNGAISIAHQVNSVNGDGTPNALHITTDANTVAILHVHGNHAQPTPSPGDRSATTQVPDFVRSQRAVYVTIPRVSTQAPPLNDYVQVQ